MLPGHLKAVLGTSSSLMKIWLYPEYPSNILRYSKPAAESISISAIGMEYSSLGVAVFKFLKSMQIRKEPFFLMTGTMLASHSTYLVVLINLHRMSRSTSAFIFERIVGANHLGIY